MSQTPILTSRVIETKLLDWRSFQFIQQENFKALSQTASDKLKQSIIRNVCIQMPKPDHSKVDPIEKEKRLRFVQEWIIEDWPSVDIVSQIVKNWNLSERQAKRYISEAKERWSSEGDELVERKRKLKIASLKKLKRSLKDQFKGTPLGIRSILAVEKEIIKLEGLNPATKLELTGKNGEPIRTVSTSVSLTADDIKNYAKQLEGEY